jgi:outer membrane receptor protein involved in Fe transport
VLLDGIPVNDPFNSYVRWSRIPLPLVERVEVVHGGGAMAWGSRSLGGVINMITASPGAPRLQATVEGGGLATYRVAASGSGTVGKLGIMVAGDLMDTDGFMLIRPDQVGTVDQPRGVQTRVGYAKLSYQVSPTLSATLAANYLDDRNRGETALSGRSATTGEVRGGVQWVTPQGGVLSVIAYGQQRNAVFTLPAISGDRTTESPRRETRLPSEAIGGTLQWTQGIGARHALTVGVDLSSVDGSYSDRHSFAAGAPTRERQSGGTQRTVGAFVQDGIRLGDRTRLLAGLRMDRIRNSDGRRGEILLATGAALSDSTYDDASETAVTYNLGLQHTISAGVLVRAAGYRAFRNATLFELNTPLYLGNAGATVVEANPNLKSETLIGGELGADVELDRRFLARVTAFWNEVSDPIVEFTVGTSSSAGQVIAPCGPLANNAVCRQRRNVGTLQSRGAEVELQWRPSRAWVIGSSYSYNPTEIISPGEPVDGKSPRGAVRNALTGTVTWSVPRVADFHVEARWVDARFDDDRNTIRLDPFTVLGMSISHPISPRLTAYVRAENLLDELYEVTRGTNGLAEVGGPRWIMAGVRGRW